MSVISTVLTLITTSALTPVMGFGGGITFAVDYNFESLNALPEGMSNTRTGGGWYQDFDGYIQNEATSNTIRIGTVYGSGRGALVEIAVTADNLYSRPSTGAVGDHLSAGSSIAAIVTEADNPSKALSAGTSVWELDNSGGGSPVDVEWAGAISSGKASASAYIKTVSGTDAALSISGNNADSYIGHTVAGYVLHVDQDRTVAAAENLRVTVPAGAVVRVATVNFQAYDVLTSFIDTSGAAVTRNTDDLNGTDVSWWSGVQEGVWYLDFTSLDDDGETSHFFEVRDTALENRFTAWQGSGTSQNTVESANVLVVNQPTPAIFNRQRVRTAMSYKNNEFIQSRNGFTEFIDTSGDAPDTTTFTEIANPLSFLSLNRTGAAPLNGILHRFSLYPATKNETAVNNLTNPNKPDELWVSMMGDSILLRWNTHFSGRPEQRFIDALTPHFTSVDVVNKGDSSSAANKIGADAQSVDYWSGTSDSGGGTSWLQAIGPDGADGISIKENTRYQRRKLDYILMNIAAGDIVAISAAVITKAQYKTSMQNVIDITVTELGPQIRFVMQYPARSTSGSYTDAAMQDVRDAMRELVAENSGLFVGDYDIYDSDNVDAVHPNEAGFNNAVDRAANIILANEGLETLKTFPEVTHVAYGGSTIILTLDRGDIVGSDTGVFGIFVDDVAVSVNSSGIVENYIVLNMDDLIPNNSEVELTVGYGKLSTFTIANAFREDSTNYPIKTSGALVAEIDDTLAPNNIVNEQNNIINALNNLINGD